MFLSLLFLSDTPVPLIKPDREALPVAVRLMAEAPCLEAVGMASSLLEPGVVLLTGGCGRRGRNTAATLLIREHTEWRYATVEPGGEKCVCGIFVFTDTYSLLLHVISFMHVIILSFFNEGVRLYHSMTSVPGWGTVILGGRTSPLNPIDDILKVTYLTDQFSPQNMLVSLEKMVCTGVAPKPRWRHTATLLSHGGKEVSSIDTGD